MWVTLYIAAEQFKASENFIAFNTLSHEPRKSSIQIINKLDMMRKIHFCIIDNDKNAKASLSLPAPLIKIEFAGRLFSGMLNSGSLHLHCQLQIVSCFII